MTRKNQNNDLFELRPEAQQASSAHDTLQILSNLRGVTRDGMRRYIRWSLDQKKTKDLEIPKSVQGREEGTEGSFALELFAANIIANEIIPHVRIQINNLNESRATFEGAEGRTGEGLPWNHYPEFAELFMRISDFCNDAELQAQITKQQTTGKDRHTKAKQKNALRRRRRQKKHTPSAKAWRWVTDKAKWITSKANKFAS